VALADHLATSGRCVEGVGGFRPAAEAFAQRWSDQHSCHVATTMEQGVYEATGVTAPTGVSGSLRLAAPGDAPLLNAWALGFVELIPEAVPAEEAILTDRVERGEMWVWEYDGAPVSMVYASPPAGGISRISWVYTPPEHQRHGYASAVVAGATAAQLAAGNRCMLYTDLANPTSNGIYQAIGYRRVGDAVMLAFEPHRSPYR
jgi:predicted GNAT family acetyltransferase